MPMFFFQIEVFQLGFGIPKTQKKSSQKLRGNNEILKNTILDS